VALNPNSATVLTYSSLVLAVTGEPAAAIDHALKALRLSPISCSDRDRCTRWGQLDVGWLGCKPQLADWIDRSYGTDAITHSHPRQRSVRELVSASCLLDDTLSRVELGAVPELAVPT
jgi:hypothetical protein